MTNAEMQTWLGRLGHTNHQRLKAVRELLWHANGDGMSTEDRLMCQRADRLLVEAIRAEPNITFDKLVRSA